jgi:acetyl-CoA acetyltransferase
LEQVLDSPDVYKPLTKLQCCPTSDGAAAAMLVSECFAMRHGLSDDCVEIVAQEMTTDTESSFIGKQSQNYNPNPKCCWI